MLDNLNSNKNGFKARPRVLTALKKVFSMFFFFSSLVHIHNNIFFMAGEVEKYRFAYTLLTLLFDINCLVYFVSTRWQELRVVKLLFATKKIEINIFPFNIQAFLTSK